jgi:hypothetical protein
MLETALEWSKGDAAKALAWLKSSGYSFRKGRERDPAFAAHVPNTADTSATFSYSAEGTPGHETCCGGRPRGMYQGDRLAARLPFIWGIATARNGRTMITAPLMSATADGTHRAVIPWDEIKDGTWAPALDIGLSPDRPIVTAIAATIIELAHETGVERFAAAVTPAARTADGRIPVPVPECMPAGYWERPSVEDTARQVARATQAAIAARRPKIALAWGASAGAVFAGPLKLRQSGIWELTGEPRRGKTTTLMLAASVWGYPELPPDGMLISWDQTSKGAGRHLGELSIFPAFIDETGTADFGPDEWAKLTYSLSLGASRQTAKTRGSMGTNRTPGWQGFLFTTGNGTITEGATAGKFAGVAARVVTLSGEFTADHDECKQLDAAVLADYGHIGPTVIEMLTVDEFGRMYAAALKAIDAPPGGIAGTLAGKIALAVAGARAIDLVLGTGTAIGDAAHRGALDYLANLAPAETDRERILRWLAESMSSERGDWATQSGYDAWGTQGDRQSRKLAGVYDDTWVYVYPSTWAEITASTGVGASARLALADMHARGELHVPDARRRSGEWQTPGPRWAGSPRVYKIGLAAIADAGDAGTPDTPDAGDEPSSTSPDAGDAGDAGLMTLPMGDSDTAPDAGTPVTPDAGDAHTLTSTDAGDAGLTTLPMGNAPEGWPADSIGAAVNDTAPASPQVNTRMRVPVPAPAAPAPKVMRVPAPAPAPIPAPASPQVTEVMRVTGTEGQRRAWLDATWKRRDNDGRHFRTADQRAALTRIVTLLDENPSADDKDAVRSLANRLHVLSELEGTGQTFGGPFIPTLHKEAARLKPWKRDGLPVCAETAHVIEGYTHQRDDYRGPVTVFDRNGAWVGSAGSALVAHGALEHTGECDPAATMTAPGYYLMTAYPWTEPGMPSPLGSTEPGTQVWIPAPTAGLLAELANAGRWPDATASDSWTGTPITLAAWGRLIRELRRYALERHGYDSGAYQAAKDAISMSLAMWTGELADDSARPVRVWKKCKTERIDWRHQIITNSAAFTWRAMDRCRQMAGGNPDLAPIGLRNKDELLIPDNGAAELVTTTPYPGGNRPPVRVDNTGVALGTFKVKSREHWA